MREKDIAKYTRLNDQIRAPEVRVIDEDGKQLGILSKNEAIALAQEHELDLVEISPNANPPVCKIIDWGKYNYQKTKQQQKNRKTSKATELKQIRSGLKISDHDLQIKMDRATKFLEAGHKVKFTLIYRGREQAHREIGFDLAQKIINNFGESVVVDQQPQLAGKQLSMVFRSSGKSVTKEPEQIIQGEVNAQA